MSRVFGLGLGLIYRGLGLKKLFGLDLVLGLTGCGVGLVLASLTSPRVTGR